MPEMIELVPGLTFAVEASRVAAEVEQAQAKIDAAFTAFNDQILASLSEGTTNE